MFRFPESPFAREHARVEQMISVFRARLSLAAVPPNILQSWSAHAFGAGHDGRAKLTHDERNDVARSDLPTATLALRYNISTEYVRKLQRRGEIAPSTDA